MVVCYILKILFSNNFVPEAKSPNNKFGFNETIRVSSVSTSETEGNLSQLYYCITLMVIFLSKSISAQISSQKIPLLFINK